ncbi:putative Cdc25 phosphatase [Paratrimastix pyriformis]|uniref:protein-tyrosine-phosphatase n=1 Tax=Paratrimastix pyriformis TaxID=342808 RepID=A0ABQ8UP97_9EUKA|nr:putative Cdc25 phosphatase [Paratrimastix pyriformis]|eukprot:GAFH01001319.1.p2 GENE.GAFH01001319.1~~GAFH01001319.1.p2  ORF type:complete len:294 (-),score=27.94 GAFH01001319.1:785-1666(-)
MNTEPDAPIPSASPLPSRLHSQGGEVSVQAASQDSQAFLSQCEAIQQIPSLLPFFNNSRTADLHSIQADTLIDCMRKKMTQYCIVDARFPYEFKGGHFSGAFNLWKEEDLRDFLIKTPSTKGHHCAIIFHCEYSSQRAPTLLRALRRMDREISVYPNLYYPHLYLLDGGYKAFYEKFGQTAQDVLHPAATGYVSMFDPRYSSQMRACLAEATNHRTQRRRMMPIRHTASLSGPLRRAAPGWVPATTRSQSDLPRWATASPLPEEPEEDAEGAGDMGAGDADEGAGDKGTGDDD